MSRKSRYPAKEEEKEEKKEEENKKYKGCIYRRISFMNREDDINEHSLGNQEKIALRRLQELPEIELTEIYTDINVSGMTFERPDFKKMMSDIRSGKIDCIIVKDITRLGRNFLHTSELINKILPELKVRLISINDNYDSERIASNNEDITLKLQMIVNEHYTKDIGKKISSSIQTSMKRGEYKVPDIFVPYGYRANQEGVFEIDEETAPVVKRIYELRAEGNGYSRIAGILTREGIECPSNVKKRRKIVKTEKETASQWNDYTVKVILTNPVYIGTRQHNKIKAIEDKSALIEIKNAHKKIITEELFNQVQEINEEGTKKYKENNTIPKVKNDYRTIFQGKLYCGHCGQRLTAKKVRGKQIRKKEEKITEYTYYFTCSRNARSGGVLCKSYYFSQEKMMEVITRFCNNQIKEYLKENTFNECESIELKQKDKEIEKIELEIKKANQKRIVIIEEYVEQRITKEEYEEKKVRIDERIKYYNKKLDEVIEERKTINKKVLRRKQIIKSLSKKKEIDKLNRELLDAIIEKIIIYDANTIHIVAAFNGQ